MNVPEMTIGGEKPVDTTELDELRMENKELVARCNAYEEQLRAAGENAEKAYMRSRTFTRGGKWSMIKLMGILMMAIGMIDKT
ncbi:MAG: hypothetical protein K6G34_13220 [Lachnospiraceae bacterium]|nr:hypothetical protein [Lachnospiraceae bacterium]